ncbi:aminopeptidase [Actinoplanes sp. ATCC 53533]|uniref:M20/M25/M40 family metallo-hydrolase n=1 Tax=Actinoplanes sp. ATCC 53533 TaxID=1288362 RepID=UPI000F777461|nr:M20/M25/M40 family metallo-hydrolase [Actinoplanes sp. ATCC 53533]RSM74161.1 aminopeptidase [Actinoplanes sp. ATCC 53533]
MRKLAIPAAVLLLVTLAASPAAAVDTVNSKKIRDAVTVSGILGHERALQRIANNNGGTRASGTPGYAASAAYVKNTLKAAGYKVKEQEFTFPFFRELAPATLAQVTPTPTTYQTGTYPFSGSGTVTGTVVPTNDVLIPPPATPGSTSGCEAADFPPAPAGPSIALIQRGTCFFEVKAANAVAAGYDAVIFFNEGQPGRDGLFIGTLGRAFGIPVVGVSFADGAALYAATQAGPVTARVTTSTVTDDAAKTTNVIADTSGGDPNKVVVVGAHLDSVVAGPGINDNGSGTAAILEIAEQMAALKVKPRQKVRFAFWGAEEANLLGSEHYVANLSDTELGKIYANLNFDMLGSPNYVRFVYDGDGSGAGDAGPPGSDQIEAVFNNYFASQNLASEPTEFNGRSDYGPFIAVGIPAGGLFSGAEGIKTPAQAAVYGGTAGAPYDPCYHAACDTTNNLNTAALHELGDAATHAVYTLAVTKTGLFPDGSLRAARKAAPDFDYKGPHALR